MSRAKFIKVTEEFSNSDAILDNCLSDSSECVVNIVRYSADCVFSSFTNCSLWVKVPTVVKVTTNTEKLVTSINIFTEVEVVNFIYITFIHVFTEDLLLNVFASVNAQ